MQYKNMVSTTVEKALFIVVGLGIFAIVGVPLFNVITKLQGQNSYTTEDKFDWWARLIEVDTRALEDDNSHYFHGELVVPGNLSITQPDNSYTLHLALDDGDVYLERDIHCYHYPFKVTYAGPGPERPVMFEMYYEGGFIYIILGEIE
ncbi:MAG: hypothetical protein ACFFCS_23150 [Candidatus Hodarchaeota archaeon]